MTIRSLKETYVGTPEARFRLAFTLIFIIAFFVRAAAIETRPLHSDEGVNYHFLEEVRSTGIYPYSHENYHGPLYFWLVRGATALLGDSVLGLRFVSIVAGCLLLVLLFPLGRFLGKPFVLLAAAFVALSPSLVFFSRNGIHEMLFLFGSAWFAIDFYLMLFRLDRRRIYTSAAALAVMVTTKETFVIMGAAVAASAALAVALSWTRTDERIVFARENGPHFAFASMLFFFLTFVSYSSGFRSFAGIRELFLALQQWLVRGTTSDIGHFKPVSYYLLHIFGSAEPYLLVAYPCIAGLLLLFSGWFFYARRETHPAGLLFCLYSSLLALLLAAAYSLIPYKTPWLVVNISYPALLCLAAWLGLLFAQGRVSRYAASAIAAIVLFLMASKTYYYNFDPDLLPLIGFKTTEPYGNANPFSYVHTSPGMMQLISDIEAYWRRKPQAKVLVGVSSYWPLPYYLRKKKDLAGYFIPDDPSKYLDEYDVVVVDSRSPWYVAGWPRKYYRLSDVQEANVFFKP